LVAGVSSPAQTNGSICSGIDHLQPTRLAAINMTAATGQMGFAAGWIGSLWNAGILAGGGTLSGATQRRIRSRQPIRQGATGTCSVHQSKSGRRAGRADRSRRRSFNMPMVSAKYTSFVLDAAGETGRPTLIALNCLLQKSAIWPRLLREYLLSTNSTIPGGDVKGIF
jgi:hypothetical protein